MTLACRTAQSGRTPLSYAAEHGDVPLVRLLLLRGAVVDASCQARRPVALHSLGKCSVQRLSLWRCARCIRVQDGKTPLHYAAERGRHECLWLLLESGATVDSRELVCRPVVRLQRDATLPPASL